MYKDFLLNLKLFIYVVKEFLPEDWNEGSYYEYDDRDDETKEFKKIKYRYYIKDKKQLDEVYQYYDRYENLPF